MMATSKIKNDTMGPPNQPSAQKVETKAGDITQRLSEENAALKAKLREAEMLSGEQQEALAEAKAVAAALELDNKTLRAQLSKAHRGDLADLPENTLQLSTATMITLTDAAGKPSGSVRANGGDVVTSDPKLVDRLQAKAGRHNVHLSTDDFMLELMEAGLAVGE